MISDLFLIILDMSVRQDKVMLHDEKSFKMAEKHEGRRNSVSSRDHKYFTKKYHKVSCRSVII